MKKFEAAWEYLKENEGGYNYEKDDRGGATKYGISLRFLKGLGEEGDINEDGEIDIKDIQILSTEEAKQIYKEHFWIKAKCEQIKNPKIAIKVFDICVNFGVSKGIKILQSSINKMYDKSVLHVDGIIGEKTLEAVNNADSTKLMKSLIYMQKYVYEEIVRMNPSQEKFLKGWKRRARREPTF